MSLSRPRILFFAEGATLAHVVRPFALARALDPAQFDVIFCRPPAFRWLTSDARFRVIDLRCQEGAVFARRLKYGWPLYDFGTLEQYVEDDFVLIDAVQPDVIVGDFRLSLSVSARRRSVPYITICDAYWSPERPLRPPLPVLGFTRFTPLPVAELLSRCVSRLALWIHAVPMERLRVRYGMPSLGHDLRRCYTDADLRLFANFSLLFPEVPSGGSTEFIGPVTWFPDTFAAPDFHTDDEPLIYVTLGSSGNPDMLDKIIPVLEQTGCRIMVATAGRQLSFRPSSTRTQVFEYLPGNIVCQKAQLVVCNGGSPTTGQALANGVPVLGIAHNMDQFLNMQAIERFGAGLTVRSDRVDSDRLRQAVKVLMQNRAFGDRARELAASVSSESGASILAKHVISYCRK
jgi:UDP:flavonoid glycosyltransferase YjiC (YdhE family)